MSWNNAIHKVAEHLQDIPPAIKHVADGAAVTTALGAFLGWLPDIAAGLSCIWLLIQIYAWIEKRVQSKKQDKE